MDTINILLQLPSQPVLDVIYDDLNGFYTENFTGVENILFKLALWQVVGSLVMLGAVAAYFGVFYAIAVNDPYTGPWIDKTIEDVSELLYN